MKCPKCGGEQSELVKVCALCGGEMPAGTPGQPPVQPDPAGTPLVMEQLDIPPPAFGAPGPSSPGSPAAPKPPAPGARGAGAPPKPMAGPGGRPAGPPQDFSVIQAPKRNPLPWILGGAVFLVLGGFYAKRAIESAPETTLKEAFGEALSDEKDAEKSGEAAPPPETVATFCVKELVQQGLRLEQAQGLCTEDPVAWSKMGERGGVQALLTRLVDAGAITDMRVIPVAGRGPKGEDVVHVYATLFDSQGRTCSSRGKFELALDPVGQPHFPARNVNENYFHAGVFPGTEGESVYTLVSLVEFKQDEQKGKTVVFKVRFAGVIENQGSLKYP